MQKSPLNFKHYRCDSRKTLLKDCNSVIEIDGVNYEERRILLLRANINPFNVDDRLKICAAHQDLLGKKFYRYMKSGVCRYKAHLDINTKPNRTITYMESRAASQCHDLDLPVGMPICNLCHTKVVAMLEKVPMDFQTPSNTPETGNDADWNTHNESHSDSNSEVDSLSQQLKNLPLTRRITRANPIPQDQIDQQMPLAEPVAQAPQRPRLKPVHMRDEAGVSHQAKIDIMNQMMELNGVEKFPGPQHFKRLRYQDCSDKGRKRTVLKGFARAVVAILKTLSESDDDLSIMWNDLMTSGLVEKELGVEPEMSRELQENVRLYNLATGKPDVRRKLLAMLYPCYRYCEINRFNEKAEIAIDNGDNLEEIDISKIETKGLVWDPPVTPYLWKQAGIHSKGGALEEVVRQPVVKWKFSLECVQEIQRYVNDPSVTQKVAYGTRQVVDAYGNTVQIANISRLEHDSELARQIETHLKAKKIAGPIPSWRTIWTILQNMPASRSRSLEVRIHIILG